MKTFFRGIMVIAPNLFCGICSELDLVPNPMPEDAGIEPSTVATLAMAVRRTDHSARSHLQSARSHPQVEKLIKSFKGFLLQCFQKVFCILAS